MSLNDLELKIQYRSNTSEEIINEFYIPVLKESITYKRAVGYFSSSALLSISKGISQLIKNKGKIELVVSQVLSKKDIISIEKGYINRTKLIEKKMFEDFIEPDNYIELERFNYLAHLIANNQLDIKVAVVDNENNLSIYHEKIGIMQDKKGNSLAFTGSLNESKFSYTNNFESIDVYCSWTNCYDKERVQNKILDFNSLWNNRTNNIEVYQFPDALKNKILQYKKDTIVAEENLISYGNINSNFKGEENWGILKIPSWLHLREYQLKAIKSWEKNNFIGLLNMATGTGKTLTALAAMVKLFNTVKTNLLVIILCPYTHLVEQWKENIEKFDIQPIIAYSSCNYNNWTNDFFDIVYKIRKGTLKFGCIITTNATYKSNKFQNILKKYNKDVLLIVDEAHNVGADEISKYLHENFKYRLALSATPERYNDTFGTDKILKYFNKIIFEFTLEKAIDEGFLTPYYYFPKIVYLNEIERKKYKEISLKISKIINSKNENHKDSYIEQLLIKRARIIAGAENKLLKLKEIMIEKTNSNYNLIYCGATKTIDEKNDSVKQLISVTNILGNELRMKVAKFTSEEDIFERKSIIDRFNNGKDLQAIVAIKCLDEGVDIPSIQNVYILASSSNPREFIQRRGRVLRKFPGKNYAYIYDFIVLPRSKEEILYSNDSELKFDLPIIKKELTRMKEFSNLALNTFKSIQEIETIINLYEDFNINLI